MLYTVIDLQTRPYLWDHYFFRAVAGFPGSDMWLGFDGTFVDIDYPFGYYAHNIPIGFNFNNLPTPGQRYVAQVQFCRHRNSRTVVECREVPGYGNISIQTQSREL